MEKIVGDFTDSAACLTDRNLSLVTKNKDREQ
jgi:hypothetical protein